jgi:hypothetical protein
MESSSILGNGAAETLGMHWIHPKFRLIFIAIAASLQD